MVGDVVPGRAVVWARADRPSRMIVTWKTSATSSDVRRMVGPYCIDVSDYTGRVELTDLPAGQTILYDVQFEDLRAPNGHSEPVQGSFRTPSDSRDIVFLWSGDEVGQGWGINPDWGGMKIFETMRQRQPDFFIHSGDTIYADGPIVEQVRLADGSVWRNLVSEEKSKVAETLDEFRGNYRYNLMDTNRRRFNAEVPQIWQWDDHEVTNNWSDSKVLDARYTEQRVQTLTARATRAFLGAYDHLKVSWAICGGVIAHRKCVRELLDSRVRCHGEHNVAIDIQRRCHTGRQVAPARRS
jgi:alkaline phosphatase D